jgi:thiamine pyrophosphokinase
MPTHLRPAEEIQEVHDLKALIVADGDVPSRVAIERLLGAPPDLVVAADGGALKAERLGYAPDVVVGDQDSLSTADAGRLQAAGSEVVVHPAAKDESDTELAVREAVTRGATRLLIVGAFGGARLEHTIANLLLLAMPELSALDVRLADARSDVGLIEGGRALQVPGEAGDFVSLFPLEPRVEGVTTHGLAYPLTDEPLVQGPARGLSNVMTGSEASISTRAGRLLVVHTRPAR